MGMKRMNVATSKGDMICNTKEEIEAVVRNNAKAPFDDIWISDENNYPCLAILVNGDYACVHYFLNEDGDMWQCVGACEEDVTFRDSGGEEAKMPGDSVISLEDAIECIKAFVDTGKRPDCIRWRQL